MAAITAQQRAYQATSDRPMNSPEINSRMVLTAMCASYFALSFICKFALNLEVLAFGFAVGAVTPLFFYGTKVYTDWIPKLAWKLPKGEIIRKLTNVPNIGLGLDGWRSNSTHSNHFDQNLADALVGMCNNDQLTTHADFECAGRGEYSQTLRSAGIESDAFDFSVASVNRTVHLATLDEQASREYDLVTSFEVVSKTLPGEEETFIKKLINSTKPNGVIAMSCAVPGQAGPNSNHHTNEEIIAIFKKYGCKHDDSASWKLRRSTNPMHPWLKHTIMVFKKLPMADA